MQESQMKNTTKKFRIFVLVYFFETEATTTTQNSLTELDIKRPDPPQSSLLLENCSEKMTETNA
jgi:hypothetical protein